MYQVLFLHRPDSSWWPLVMSFATFEVVSIRNMAPVLHTVTWLRVQSFSTAPLRSLRVEGLG